MVLLVVLIMFISYMAWKNVSSARQMEALLKKNWAVWVFNWKRNLMAYAIPLILVFVLYFVITNFTKKNIVREVPINIPFAFEQYSTQQYIRLVVELVDESRIKMYQNLR